MNLKELTQEYLRKEGFCPEETDFGLYFKCEGKNFLLIYDDDDEQYFRLMMPCIFEMTDENQEAVYHAMNEVNSSVKVIKAYIMRENEVWLGFEVLADNTPVVDDFIPRAINMLNSGARKFYQALQEG